MLIGETGLLILRWQRKRIIEQFSRIHDAHQPRGVWHSPVLTTAWNFGPIVSDASLNSMPVANLSAHQFENHQFTTMAHDNSMGLRDIKSKSGTVDASRQTRLEDLSSKSPDMWVILYNVLINKSQCSRTCRKTISLIKVNMLQTWGEAGKTVTDIRF